jgi:alpha-tubulin suppressor-like RCC1 family protein
VPFLLQREWRNQTELFTVAAGWDRSFFVDANGELLACGCEGVNEVGLLGLQGGASQTSFAAVAPTPVPSMAGVCVRAVACHLICNLAVSEEGQVFEWGRDVEELSFVDDNLYRRQPPVPTIIEELRDHRVRQVVMGRYHCAAVTEDGALFAWETERAYGIADEERAELGYGDVAYYFGVPRRVYAFEGVRIASVAVGAVFTVAVTDAGQSTRLGRPAGALVTGRWIREISCSSPSASRR